jgi:cyclopropane-fatty-acyl-phospholipid synthase
MNAPLHDHRLGREKAMPRALKILLRLLENLQRGTLIVTLPDGSIRHFSGREVGASATLRIHDYRFAGAVLRGSEIGLAEAYRDGWCSTSDLTQLLLLAIENEKALQQIFYSNPIMNVLHRTVHWLRANSRRGSRKNIAAHYDLSNDFYQLWLDPTMTYSAACLDGDYSRELQVAQEAKYARIIEQLGIDSSHHVLEIGCGWGGFAEYAARTTGAKITGVTISNEQLKFAQQRIREAGLDDRVTLKFCDYRDIAGSFDRIVSIEMFEAVGERYWPHFFAVVSARLKQQGRALIQTITIANELFATYRVRVDFIQRYIFPGGMLPSPAGFKAQVQRAGLAVRDQFRFGRDYALTLRRWHAQFMVEASALENLGFDQAFQRLWQFYFCYCEAGFDSGRTDVMQFELVKERGGQ